MVEHSLHQPDQEFSNQQGRQIMLKEKRQCQPEQGLSDDISQQAGEQNWPKGFLSPNGIEETDHAFDEDRDRQSLNHCFLER